VLGGPGEEDTVEEVASRLREVPHVSRNLYRLREFTEALAGADLFLGNDCGPRHIAAALGMPTIAYFRDVNPTHWTPPEARHPVLWDTTRARGRPVGPDLRILPVEPEAAARAAAELLAGEGGPGTGGADPVIKESR
jgi:ADP-heptose:LPS heptosyltransferase